MSLSVRAQKATVNARTYLYLRRLLHEAKLTAEQTQQLQFDRLRRLLISAYENHDFYKARFDQAGFDPYQFSHMEQFSQIPVLTKSEYRDYTKKLYSENPGHYRYWYTDTTSGSTGAPLTVWRTWEERAYQAAKWMRVLYLNGYSWRQSTFSLAAAHRLKKDSVIQRLGIMKRHMVVNTAPIEFMDSEYLRVRPDVFYGNKSQLVEMALYARDNLIPLPAPKFYVSAAETLDDKSREIITSVFGPNLSEVYGAVEFNTLAWRCSGRAYFDISHTTNVIELANEDKVSGKDPGHCIITDLFVHSFPLIRYQLGDLIESDCVNGLPVITRILGRQNDWIVFKDGTRKPFHPFWQIMRRRPEILQFRIIQESPDLLRVVLAKDPSAGAQTLESVILADLKKEIRDGDIEYKFEWVDKIPADPNGKLRVLVSKVLSQ